jgi:rare lipoprotein A
MRKALAVAGCLGLALASCGEKRTVRAAVPPSVFGNEIGIASWYGHPYHGRPAANGEIYDMEQFTAAHRTLPFGTLVRVVNLENNKSVDVRITDRGPFVGDRVIDLSHAAARAIDMLGPGTARVRVEITRSPPAPLPGFFAVQVGAFKVRANAERLQAEMQSRYGAAHIVLRPGDPPLWRVLVGRAATVGAANSLATRIGSEHEGKLGQPIIIRDDAVNSAM